MKNFRCWLRRCGLLAVGLLVVATAFNYVVDPYAIYAAVSIPGVNDNKHVATSHSRLIKPYLLRRLQPKGLILGSSRAEVGLDPGHQGWGVDTQPVYNFAVGGVGLVELVGRFADAVDYAPVQKALVGLDFYMFNAHVGDWNATYAATSNSQLYAKTLLTIDAIKASIETLRKNDAVEYPGLLKSGQVAWTFNERRVRKYGHKNGFLRFEQHFMEESIFPLPLKKYEFHDLANGKDSFAQFRKLLKLARDSKVDLRLFISPVHARLLIVFQQNGLWEEYRDWKRTLVKILEEDAAAHPGEPAFLLYDFSGINSITEEPVPLDGDRQTRMVYYWESSHYKKETGDLIQNRMFVENAANPPGFGVLIHVDNIEQILEDTDKKLARYIATHQHDYQEIVKLKSASTWFTQ